MHSRLADEPGLARSKGRERSQNTETLKSRAKDVDVIELVAVEGCQDTSCPFRKEQADSISTVLRSSGQPREMSVLTRLAIDLSRRDLAQHAA